MSQIHVLFVNYGEGKFDPDNNTTRQFEVYLNRVIDEDDKLGDPEDQDWLEEAIKDMKKYGKGRVGSDDNYHDRIMIVGQDIEIVLKELYRWAFIEETNFDTFADAVRKGLKEGSVIEFEDFGKYMPVESEAKTVDEIIDDLHKRGIKKDDLRQRITALHQRLIDMEDDSLEISEIRERQRNRRSE